MTVKSTFKQFYVLCAPTFHAKAATDNRRKRLSGHCHEEVVSEGTRPTFWPKIPVLVATNVEELPVKNVQFLLTVVAGSCKTFGKTFLKISSGFSYKYQNSVSNGSHSTTITSESHNKHIMVFKHDGTHFVGMSMSYVGHDAHKCEQISGRNVDRQHFHL